MNAKLKTPEKLVVANPGANHCGMAMVGPLVTMGFEVNFFNRGEERLRGAGSTGGAKLSGEVVGFADFITRFINGVW
jgi:hypothetical protein